MNFLRLFFKWLLRIVLLIVVVLLIIIIKVYVVFGVQVKERDIKPSITRSLINGEEITTAEEWETSKQRVIEALEDTVYGAFPDMDITWETSRRVVDENAYEGKATIEELTISVNEMPGSVFRIALVIPKNQENPPLLLSTGFCGNNAALNRKDISTPTTSYPAFCDEEGGSFIFGDKIKNFPIEDVIDQGLAYATFYAAEIVPDRDGLAQVYMKNLSQFSSNPIESSISAWAWGYSFVLDILQEDLRINQEEIAVLGHSRYGKAALWAAANDSRIKLVLSLQSGTGGATLNQSNRGESIASITKSYPYWFIPSYKGILDSDPVIDQQFLLGLIAPRPVLLGNASFDQWSDPRGAFESAREAAKIYNLYEENSFQAQNLRDFHPEDLLSFWMRTGPHGIRSSDWESMLRFLRLHLVP